MAKARELHLIYERAEATERVSLQEDTRITQMEETLQVMSQQLAALTTQQRNTSACQCFRCGKPGHLARNCRSYIIQLKWNALSVDEEVTWPENAGAREMPVGVLHPVEQRAPPVDSECSHNGMHTHTYTTSFCYTSCKHYWKSRKT